MEAQPPAPHQQQTFAPPPPPPPSAPPAGGSPSPSHDDPAAGFLSRLDTELDSDEDQDAGGEADVGKRANGLLNEMYAELGEERSIEPEEPEPEPEEPEPAAAAPVPETVTPPAAPPAAHAAEPAARAAAPQEEQPSFRSSPVPQSQVFAAGGGAGFSLMNPAQVGQALFKRADEMRKNEQVKGVASSVADRANGLRERVAGLQGGFGDLRSKIEALSTNFDSFENRLAGVDQDNATLFKEGEEREKKQRQLRYIQAADGSQAETFDAELKVGGYSCVGTVAAFGATGARLNEVPSMMTQPPLANTALANAALLKGALAIIERGVVPFVEKARRAQAAECAAVLFINSEDKPYVPLGMEGDGDITVPVMCVKKEDGDAIKALLSQHPGAKASASYGDAPMVQAGPEEMLTQFFDSCIRQTKMSMEEHDWEGAVLNIKRYLEFRETVAESLTDEERAVMQAEQILAMSEVMKDLENKLVLSLLGGFGEMAQKDDVAVMRVYLDLLSKLGHAKQCVGSYTAHLSQIADIEFSKMDTESFVSALERLLSSR